MRTMKSTLRLLLILYLCMFLTGAPFVLSASAKITPKSSMDGTKLITIEKGDTLWHLAAKHLNDPFLWKELKKYNDFTNPHLIYPAEKLQLPGKVVMSTAAARKAVDIGVAEGSITPEELDAIKKQLNNTEAGVDSATNAVLGLKNQIEQLSKHNEELNKQNQMLQSGLQKLKNELQGMPKSTGEDHGQAIGRLNAALMDQAEASKMEMSKIGSRIEPLQADLNQIGESQRQQAEDLQALSATAQSLTGGIEKNAQGINDLAAGISKVQDDMGKLKSEEGEWEEPSKSKRTFAILAALAGGTAFFVVNAIGSSD